MTDILVVSDVSWVVNDVRSALTDGRFTVRTENDPRAVVDAVRDTPPDAVLVDFQVGSMGGMAVTRAIRDAASTGTGRRPPIVLLLDRDADGFLAGRSGADAWLRKPFTADAVRATLDGLLAEAPGPQ
jgi:DNA-binding response OmpR family regulator